MSTPTSRAWKTRWNVRACGASSIAGLDAVVGYLLPLEKAKDRSRVSRSAPESAATPPEGPDEPGRMAGGADARWTSGHWFLRDERLYLMPGDSPMGYRLPLDSLPWAKAGERQACASRRTRSQHLSPLTLAEAAPRRQSPGSTGQCTECANGAFGGADLVGSRCSVIAEYLEQRFGRSSQGVIAALARRPRRCSARRAASAEAAPEAQESAGWLTRTALCVEVRDPQRANGPKAEAAALAEKRCQERRALCLSASAETSGGLSGTAGCDRSGGGGDGRQAGAGRLPAAA